MDVEKFVASEGPSVEIGLAERAYAVIRERIVRGDYLMGQVISRRRVAADLGISFLPASEALLRLECEGLLESRPRAGTRVRIPTREVMQGNFVVREALQVQAAMMFSLSATREERRELAKLASYLDSGMSLQSAGPVEWLTLHEKLHWKIAEYAHCDELYHEMRKQSALASAWLCTIGFAMPEGEQPSHERLMNALTRQNSQTAAETMRAHVRSEMENILRALESSFEMNKKHMLAYSRTIGGKPRARKMAIGRESAGSDLPPAYSTVA